LHLSTIENYKDIIVEKTKKGTAQALLGLSSSGCKVNSNGRAYIPKE